MTCPLRSRKNSQERASRDELWLGVVAQPVTPVLHEALNIPEDQKGALISGVAPNSPAARAGLRDGDIIVEIESQAINNARELSLDVARRGPGSQVRIDILRNGRRQEVERHADRASGGAAPLTRLHEE